MGEDEDRRSRKRKPEDPGRAKRNTFRGYGAKVEASDLEPQVAEFEDEEVVSGAVVEAQPLARDPGGGRPVRRGQPAVDIDLIHERRTAPLPDHEWTFVEIWTRNTIYALDSHLVCIAVIDQNSRRPHADHALLGARLVGGQLRDGETMELSHPFPRPGSEAVFEQSKGRQVRFSQTSSVTRVVLRLRVLTVSSDNLLPTWEEITGRHDVAVPVSGSKGSKKKR